MSVNFESNLKNVKKALSNKEEKSLKLIGELLEGQAKLMAPVGQKAGGDLRQSIEYKVFAGGKEKGVAVGTDLHYGIYVEKGTGIYAKEGDGRKDPWVYYDPLTGQFYRTEGMKPQPFLEPAAMRNVSKIKNIVEKVLSELNDNN
jgi:HK97 gp10 family phage protein